MPLLGPTLKGFIASSLPGPRVGRRSSHCGWGFTGGNPSCQGAAGDLALRVQCGGDCPRSAQCHRSHQRTQLQRDQTGLEGPEATEQQRVGASHFGGAGCLLSGLVTRPSLTVALWLWKLTLQSHTG